MFSRSWDLKRNYLSLYSTFDDQEYMITAGASSSAIMRKSNNPSDSLVYIPEIKMHESSFRHWYEPGKDLGSYNLARAACRRFTSRLNHLKDLSRNELQYLESHIGSQLVEQVLQDTTKTIQDACDNSSTNIGSQALVFVERIGSFLVRFSGIVELLLPQSPEYTVSYGAVVILFKAVIYQKRIEESLITFIDKMALELPMVDFYRLVFPTNEMKTAVAKVYATIMDTLLEAILYFRSSRLGKLIDALGDPIESRFKNCTSNVIETVAHMNELKDAAHVAQQSDMKSIIESTSFVVAKLYEQHEMSTQAISVSLTLLDQNIEAVNKISQGLVDFHAMNKVQEICDQILPDAPDFNEEANMTSTKMADLSQRETWENNGILGPLRKWSQSRHKLLWLGGRSGERQSWVTMFSRDLNQAMQIRGYMTAHIFCDNTRGPAITPLSITKRLIIQILLQKPDLAIEMPEKVNTRVLRNGTKTFQSSWKIFTGLLSKLSYLFIVIDRLDSCVDDDHSKIHRDLLPRFFELLESHDNVDIVVTSIFVPPKSIHGHEKLMDYWIETGRRPIQRLR